MTAILISRFRHYHKVFAYLKLYTRFLRSVTLTPSKYGLAANTRDVWHLSAVPRISRSCHSTYELF